MKMKSAGEAEPGRSEKIGTFLLNSLFAERSWIRAMVRHESFRRESLASVEAINRQQMLLRTVDVEQLIEPITRLALSGTSLEN
jgi:hypothetical protein